MLRFGRLLAQVSEIYIYLHMVSPNTAHQGLSRHNLATSEFPESRFVCQCVVADSKVEVRQFF